MRSKSNRLSGRLADGTECVLYLSDDGRRLEVDRDHQDIREVFDAPEQPERLVMAITSNQVATLTGVYRTRRQSNFSRSFEEYRANIIYVGPTELQLSSEITRLRFRPTNERLAVMYNGHRIHHTVDAEETTLKAISAREQLGSRYIVDVIDAEKRRAFISASDGLSVSGDVNLTIRNNIQGHDTIEERITTLSFATPVSVALAFSNMLSICDFMSLMVGAVVSPASVQLETDGEADRHGRSPSFDVHANWREPGREIDPQKGRRCLAAPLFDRAGYESALTAWISRKALWRSCHALGTVYLSHDDELSRRRFLDAEAWFESLPTECYERPRTRVAKDVVTAAAKAAAAAFREGNSDVSEGRARALLGPVNAASLNVRLDDAMAQARNALGLDLLPLSLDKLAAAIPKIRGKFAHGEDAFASEVGHLIYDATLLLAVLTSTLSLQGLGIQLSADMSGHPLRTALRELQDYGIDQDDA